MVYITTSGAHGLNRGSLVYFNGAQIAGGAVGATLGNSTHSTNGLPSDVSGRQQSRIYSNPSFFESRIRENHAVQTTTSVIRRTITQSQHPYLQQQRYGQTMPKYFCDTASNACYWY